MCIVAIYLFGPAVIGNYAVADSLSLRQVGHTILTVVNSWLFKKAWHSPEDDNNLTIYRVCIVLCLITILKAGLYYQSFCDQSRNFA